MVNVFVFMMCISGNAGLQQSAGFGSKSWGQLSSVTLTSGPRVGLAKSFPPLNLSKVVHTGMEGVEQAHAPEHQSATKKRAAASCSDDEHPSKKAAHAPASPPGDLV